MTAARCQGSSGASGPELPLGDVEQPERSGDGLAPAQVDELARELGMDEVEAPKWVEVVQQRRVLRRHRARDQDDEKAKPQILDEHRGAQLLPAARAPRADLETREELAELVRVIVSRPFPGLGPHGRHPRLDAATVEQDAVAVHASQSQLVQVEDGELEQVPVVVEDLEPMVGLAVPEDDAMGVGKP